MLLNIFYLLLFFGALCVAMIIGCIGYKLVSMFFEE